MKQRSIPRLAKANLLILILLILTLPAPVVRAAPRQIDAVQRPIELNILLLVEQTLYQQLAPASVLGYGSAALAYQWANQLLDEEEHLSLNMGIMLFDQTSMLTVPLQSVAKALEAQEYLKISLILADEAMKDLATPAHSPNYAAAIADADKLLASVPRSQAVEQRSAIILIGNGDLSQSVDGVASSLALTDLYLLRLPFGTEAEGRQSQGDWKEILGQENARDVVNIEATKAAFLHALSNSQRQAEGQREMQLACGYYQMPPYLAVANFVIHKVDPQIGVALVDASGQSLVGNRPVRANQVVETVSIQNPRPGKWQISCPMDAAYTPAIFLMAEPIGGNFTISEPLYRGIPAEVVYQPLTYEQRPLPLYGKDVARLVVLPLLEWGYGRTKEVAPLVHDPASNTFRGVIPMEDGVNRLTLQVNVDGSGPDETTLAMHTFMLKPRQIYYRLVGDGNYTLWMDKELTIELVDQNGSLIVGSPEVVAATHLNLSIDNGGDEQMTIQMTNRANEPGALTFSTNLSADVPGIHPLQVMLSTDGDASSAILVQPQGSEQESITVHLPTLQAESKQMAAFWPQPVRLVAVTYDQQQLPLSASMVVHRLEVEKSGTYLPVQKQAAFNPATNSYSVWLWPVGSLSSATIPFQWNLGEAAHAEVPIVSAQISWVNILPQQSPGEYMRLIMHLAQEYPREYIVAPLVLVGLITFLTLLAKHLIKRQRQRNALGYLTLVSADNTRHETYKLRHKKEQTWTPTQKQMFRVGRIAMYVKGKGKKAKVTVSVFDSPDGEGFAYWRDRDLLNDEAIDIAGNAQLMRTLTPYQQPERSPSVNTANSQEPTGKIPRAEEYFKAS